MKITGSISFIENEELDFELKQEAQDNELHGLNGGRIIKLRISCNGTTVFEYNRGEIVKAVNKEGAAEALAILIYKYN